jgi:uncharacterized protein
MPAIIECLPALVKDGRIGGLGPWLVAVCRRRETSYPRHVRRFRASESGRVGLRRDEEADLEFAQRHAISDVCVLVEDLERSIRFYRDRLGFRLRQRAPGFADFTSAGLTLAVWEIEHISAHTGVSARRGPGAHKACIAVDLRKPELVDSCYAELAAKGVAFQAPPVNYPWNARCCYFAGPDDELWELYAWLPGGPQGGPPAK